MPTRHNYRLNLAAYHPQQQPSPGLDLRAPTGADAANLAVLMLDAYRDTIDYDGETLEQARQEVESFLNGVYGPPLLNCSRLGFLDGNLAAACLVSRWGEHPLICFVMTGARWKNQGLAQAVLHQTLQCLAAAGHPLVDAVITEGNHPSERLFARIGFSRYDLYGRPGV